MNVHVIVNGQQAWLDAFRLAFTDQCAALGIPGVVTQQTAAPAAADGPVLFLCNSASAVAPAEEQALQSLLDAGVAILPVAASAPEAGHLPGAVKFLNSFLLDRFAAADWPAALVDEVLSMAWLARSERRLFISYRRIDSETIAHRLHDHFNDLGFDTFLDDASIPRGVDFQRELMWRLNDCDAVLLLASPRLMQSTWVTKEIHFAQSSMIELVMAVWPGVVVQNEPVLKGVMLDQLHTLKSVQIQGAATAPEKQTLTDDAVDELTHLVHVRRVRSIARRLAHLLPFARDHFAKQYGVGDGARPGDLELTDRSTSSRVMARVLPFRPGVEALYDLHETAAAMAAIPEGVGCFYEENDPNHRRALALRLFIDGQPRSGAPSRHLLWQFTGKVKP